MDMPQTKTQLFALAGGLDAESSQSSRAPGLVTGASNYESSSQNGYERIGGFERFSGQPRPSDAAYKILQTTAAVSGVVVGNTVNGQTSGATAVVIAIRSSTELVVTKVTGTFTAAENVRVITTVVGVFSRLADDSTSIEDNTYSALAATVYRTDIAAVPGSGAIRGIAALGSTVYAFRDNAGGTALEIYKSAIGGWTLVPMMRELSFNLGSGTEPAEGAVLTKGAVTCTLRRVVLTSGTWGAGTATGRMVVSPVTGGPFTAGAFTAGVTATITAVDTPITLLPGGRLDHVVYNFTGSKENERLYCADGVNLGFEFDGTTLVPIRTGMTVDTPRHVAAHRNHLFFAFKGSVQNSGIATPYVWSAVLGAAEIAIGQDVTGFSGLPGDVDSAPLMVFSETRTTVLYGTSSADWKSTTYSSNIGAQRWSVQNLGNPVVFNTLGITPVVQSQAFGNFDQAPASERVRNYLRGKTVTASVVNRQLNRMRLFFSDGDGINITAVNNVLTFMPIGYGKVVRCAIDAQISGVNRVFFGSDDGFVYEADVGRSFDGAAIEAWLKLAFNHTGSPLIKKRFRKVNVELKAQSAMTISSQGEYSLGAIDIGLSNLTTTQMPGSGGRWDVGRWDQSFYDTQEQTALSVRLDGGGTDLSMTFFSSSAQELPHLLQSVTTTYTLRRIER